MFKKISIVTLLFSVLLFSFCKKTTTVQDNIPYQTVYFTINPNEPLYFKLTAVGGWMYVSGGVNGVIIYRQTMTGATNDFIALERTSTYLPNDAGASVKVQSDNFTLKDTVSNSKWQINNGAVLSGPATLPLRQYSAIYDNGSGVLTIKN